ncbi:MAG: (d)CMP kinase [Actinomycetota bacterium]
MRGPAIAVDGPAGSGKSTVAKALAKRLGAAHVDTGAMYRALALKMLEERLRFDDRSAVAELLASTDIRVGDGKVLLDGRDVAHLIRSDEVTAASSKVAELEPVRRWMVERQRAIAEAAGSAVVEGRDIGTVVLPGADLKIFLTASEQERARRRSLETGSEAERTAAEIASRDARDSERSFSPLKAAADAVVLDTTDLSIKQVLDRILEILTTAGLADD